MFTRIASDRHSYETIDKTEMCIRVLLWEDNENLGS